MLHVDKVDTLLTEEVHISASGLKPFQCYKLVLILHYKTGHYFSYCVVQSDKSGTIDLVRDKPIRGTYHNVDPLGLFLTIQPSYEISPGHHFRNNTAKLFCYTLKLTSKSGTVLDQVNLRKHLLHPSVSKIEINHFGLHGIIFKPPGPGPFPCIIDIPAITGVIAQPHAAAFASEGFMTYSFATYSDKSFPEKLHDVEMEDFLNNIKFIQSLPYCSGKIGLYGYSFGGTIANYLATKHHGLSAVVSIFKTNNFNMKEKGEPVDCEELDGSLNVHINNIINQKDSFEKAFSGLKPQTSIQWDRIPKQTSFRVVAAVDDWLFCGACRSMYLRRQLKETGHSVEVDLVPAGHALSVSYFPHQPWISYLDKFNVGFGGECCLAAKSQETVWENHVKFFKKHLGTPPALPDFERETVIILPEENSKL